MKLSFSKFKSLIPVQLIDKLAVQYQINAKNHVRLPGQAVFLCLLNGLLNHVQLTQRMLEEQYKKMTGQSCDHSSFGKRLASADWQYFQAIFDHLYKKLSSSITRGDIQTLRLRFVDATIVTLSAKLLDFGIKANHGNKGEKRQIKSVIELSDEGLPNLLHICNEQPEFADVVALGKSIKSNNQKGDLWVFDKGCHGREVLFSLHNSGSFWITPHSAQSLDVLEIIYQDGQAPPQHAPADGQKDCNIHRVDLCVFSNKWNKIAGLEAMHILVIHCHRWDTRAKDWKPFILMTNLPLSQCRSKAGPYSFEEITEIYRRRWDIETFFKLLKQHLGYGHLTSRSENGIRIMILMSMITALLMIWYKQQTQIDRGWRSVKFWLADDTRAWTARALRDMLVWRT